LRFNAPPGPADDVGTGMSLKFDLDIEIRPPFISPVRRFVEESMERLLQDPDSVFRVAMVVHELLENAAKYAIDGKAQLSVRVEPRGDGDWRASVRLKNETTEPHVARLRRLVDEMNASEDLFALYQTLMRRNTRGTGESGLGLVRIRAEAEMELGVEVVSERTVVIAATAVFAASGGVR
jgi:two-component sensor histidine kinase